MAKKPQCNVNGSKMDSFVSHIAANLESNFDIFSPRMLAKDELISLLQRCLEILQQSKSKKIKNAHSQLAELLAKFKQLDGKLSKSRRRFEIS